MPETPLTPAQIERAEQMRRLQHLAFLEDRYRTLMAQAKAEFDLAMELGQIVRVAGFIRRRKGKTQQRKAS